MRSDDATTDARGRLGRALISQAERAARQRADAIPLSSIRCPNCGADAGRVRKNSKRRRSLICDACGHAWRS